MTKPNLATTIREKALALGYEKCGIIPIADVKDYADKLRERMETFPSDRGFLERLSDFSTPEKQHPWAKSILVTVRSYAEKRVPDHLKGHIAGIYLLTDGPSDDQRRDALGEFLAQENIRVEIDSHRGFTSMRWAAMKAGLGIIRKNNFFYTKESGSWVALEAWLIDAELTWMETAEIPPCPENCGRCMKACPTSALQEPYAMRPTICATFLTGFGDGHLLESPYSEKVGNWIFGCDQCQLACPFNQEVLKKRPITDKNTDPVELGDALSLTQILDMDYETLRKWVSGRFWYIPEEKVWLWKVNALNAMKNKYQDSYLPFIQKATQDSVEPVRRAAENVLRQL